MSQEWKFCFGYLVQIFWDFSEICWFVWLFQSKLLKQYLLPFIGSLKFLIWLIETFKFAHHYRQDYILWIGEITFKLSVQILYFDFIFEKVEFYWFSRFLELKLKILFIWLKKCTKHSVLQKYSFTVNDTIPILPSHKVKKKNPPNFDIDI